MLLKNKLLLLSGYFICSVISISLYGSDKKTASEDTKTKEESAAQNPMGASIRDALEKGNINEVVIYFEKNPQKINNRDKEGKTALEIAAGAIHLGKDQFNLVKAILNCNPAFGVALLEAVESNNKMIVDFLLKQGAGKDINKIIDDQERNALMLAKSPTITAMLLATGIDLNARDSEGNTAKMIAEKNSKQEGKTQEEKTAFEIIKWMLTLQPIMESLEKSRADPEIKDFESLKKKTIEELNIPPYIMNYLLANVEAKEKAEEAEEAEQ